MKNNSKSQSVIQIILLTTFCGFIVLTLYHLFNGALIKSKRGEPGLLYILSWFSISAFIIGISYLIKNKKISQVVRYIPIGVLCLAGLLLAITQIGYAILAILKLPFNNVDASIDLEVLTIKSWFVKICILLLEILGLIFIVSNIRLKRSKKNGNNL